MQLWQDIVLAYCEHKRMTRISVGSAAQSDLFQNHSIDRKLDTSEILQVKCPSRACRVPSVPMHVLHPASLRFSS